jgi:hypothetical protein
MAPAKDDSTGAGGMDQAPAMLPAGEPTPRWIEILQTVFLIIVGIACLILLVRLLIRLYRKLVPILKRAYAFVMEWLRLFFLGSRQLAEGDPGFVDEVESLLKQNETAFSAARRWLVDMLEREPGYGTMKNDKERVRWLYRNLVRHEIRHGYDFQPSATPRETLDAIGARVGRRKVFHSGHAAEVYDLVRYSPEVIGPEHVHDMKKACP